MTDEIPYVPARWQKARRAGARIELLVVHTMEAAEASTTAEGCASVFKRGTRQASAHRCIDNNSTVESVHLGRYAYGAGGGIGSRRINDSAVHFEHAGYARQSAADWADAYSTAMIERSAREAAAVARQFAILPRYRSVDDLRAGSWNGFTDHATIERAFPSTGHWDPGPHFPWGTYLELVASHLDEENPVAGRLIVMVPGSSPLPNGRWPYWRLNGEHILSCNGAPALAGSTPIVGVPAAPLPLGHRPILGIEAAPDGNGVVAIADDQGTFTFRVSP